MLKSSHIPKVVRLVLFAAVALAFAYLASLFARFGPQPLGDGFRAPPRAPAQLQSGDTTLPTLRLFIATAPRQCTILTQVDTPLGAMCAIYPAQR